MDCALGGDRHNKLMASTGQAKRRVSKELENRSATQIFKKGWWWTQDFCFQISFFMNSHRNSPPGHPWSMRKVAIAQAQRGQLSGLGWETAMAEIKSRRSEESMIVNEIGLWLFMTRHCRMAVHFFALRIWNLRHAFLYVGPGPADCKHLENSWQFSVTRYFHCRRWMVSANMCHKTLQGSFRHGCFLLKRCFKTNLSDAQRLPQS